MWTMKTPRSLKRLHFHALSNPWYLYVWTYASVDFIILDLTTWYSLLTVHRAQELEGWPLAMQRICCLKFWFPRSGGFPVPALELCRWRRVRHLYLSYFQTILIVHTEPSEKKHFHRFDKELFLSIQELASPFLTFTRVVQSISYIRQYSIPTHFGIL